MAIEVGEAFKRAWDKTSDKTSATKVNATLYELFELAGIPIPETHCLKFCYTRKRIVLKPCEMVLEAGKFVRDRSVWNEGDKVAIWEITTYGKSDWLPQEVIDVWVSLPNGVFEGGEPYEFKGFQ